MAPSKYTDLVLDLGGVLFSFAPTKEMSLSSRTIKHGFHSSYWHDYERGKISQEQCYDYITKEYDLAPGAWGETIDKLEATLKPIQGFLDAIKHIKTIFPHLRIHGFSNISGPDYEKLRPTVDGWAIFDSVTTSASLGHRKPDLDSYRKLQEITNIDAHTSIFVDDTPENVMNAQSLGFYGIRFQDADNVVIQLHNLLGDPVARGMEYLRQNSKDLFCESDSGVIVKDNLSQLLILQCIGDRLALLTLVKLQVTNSIAEIWLCSKMRGTVGSSLLESQYSRMSNTRRILIQQPLPLLSWKLRIAKSKSQWIRYWSIRRPTG